MRRARSLCLRPRRSVSGQAMVFVAILMPFIAALLFTAIEIGGRMVQRTAVEDALQQATRSSVQTFQYAQFAANAHALRTEDEIKALAIYLFETNLTQVGGLTKSPHDVARMVTWTILPRGGSCTVGGKPYDFGSQPAICATLQVPMKGLPGWADWTPTIAAVETIDAFTR